jgi:hypothetical protein
LLSQFGTGVGPHPLTERPPPEFAAVANEIDQYVENSRVREFMRANSGRWWTPEERLAHLLSRTLFVEVTRSTQSPGSEKLEKFLLDQPTDLQNELLARDASEFQTDLRNIYADSLKRQGDPKIEDLKEIFFGDKGPPGWNGPGRFPPDHGDRHPDDRGDGRPPGDRGPMGRDGFAGPREGRGFGPPRRGGDDGESRPAPRDGNGQGPGSDPGPPRDNRKEPPPPPPPRKDGQPPRNDAAPAERPGAPQT